MNSTSISVAGFEKLGEPNSNIHHIVDYFCSENRVNQAVCLANSSTRRGMNVDSFPLPARAFGFLLGKIQSNYAHWLPARQYSEQHLFDVFTSIKLDFDNSDLTIHTDSGLTRSVSKSSEHNTPTLILNRGMHPGFMRKILYEEEEKFGVNEMSVYTNKRWGDLREKSLHECDGVITSAPVAKQDLVENGIDDKKVVSLDLGLGVDSEYFKPSQEENSTFTVLFISHKSLIKGLPYLFEAWKELDLPNAELIIGGDQNKQLLKKYEGQIDFEYIGTVNPLPYFQKSSVYVLPSLGDPAPRTMMEAMSCGVPAIVSERVGTKHYIKDGDNGFIIPSRETSPLVKRLQFLYNNPQRSKEMGEKARGTVKDIAWRDSMKDLEEKIGSLGY